MIDEVRQQEKRDVKEKARRRMRVEIDPDNYEYIPEKKPVDYYDIKTHQRVAVYVRVSTDDVRQTTSYELQQKYYAEFVKNHPNWELVDIYPDEGISGTSLAHRDEFNRMIRDCRAGKIDLILTKSVSRFARNVMICIGVVRELSEMHPPVGVLFESEGIFSLNDDSQMALSFLATMAEEESHTRSRSMETSLRMRLDNGIPLTPELLGYRHDADGNLVINPDEAPTVKLAFYLYLLGSSTQEIADLFNQKKLRTYRGNVRWTSGTIRQILRNERHCGDVLTRKTFTPNFRNHLSKKNRGERPQSRYLNHHAAIVSRDDYIAAQQMLENAKFQKTDSKSYMPSLYVIERGLLRGFVRMHPCWGFSRQDYLDAAGSVSAAEPPDDMVKASVPSSGFEIVCSELIDPYNFPRVSFTADQMIVSKSCVQKMTPDYYIEILLDPIGKRLALRSAAKSNRRALCCAKPVGRVKSKTINAKVINDAVFPLFGWERDNKYRIPGTFFEQDGVTVCIFEASRAEALIKQYKIPALDNDSSTAEKPLIMTNGRIQLMPRSLADHFGENFSSYLGRVNSQIDWLLNETGREFETKKRINITPADEMRRFIEAQLQEPEDRNRGK